MQPSNGANGPTSSTNSEPQDAASKRRAGYCNRRKFAAQVSIKLTDFVMDLVARPLTSSEGQAIYFVPSRSKLIFRSRIFLMSTFRRNRISVGQTQRACPACGCQSGLIPQRMIAKSAWSQVMTSTFRPAWHKAV